MRWETTALHHCRLHRADRFPLSQIKEMMEKFQTQIYDKYGNSKSKIPPVNGRRPSGHHRLCCNSPPHRQNRHDRLQGLPPMSGTSSTRDSCRRTTANGRQSFRRQSSECARTWSGWTRLSETLAEDVPAIHRTTWWRSSAAPEGRTPFSISRNVSSNGFCS